MTERRTGAAFRRSVAARVLFSYAIVTAAFVVVAGFSLFAQRTAARQTDLVRTGYLPVARAVRDLAAKQDTWNTQLNHITAAKNPADIRVWFDVRLRVGRPRAFGELRDAIGRAFMRDGDSATSRTGARLITETEALEHFLKGDAERLDRLFQALDQRDDPSAERLRDELVKRGSQTSVRLLRLEESVEQQVGELLDAAQARELLAIRLLVVLSVLTVLVGALMALYARRVLAPLALVTERAKAVARGDLEPREAVRSDDEIGELAVTFERMVAAIAEANAQLLTAERLATIGKMAAHVTHEIRNPLSSIALNLELLEEQFAQGAPVSRQTEEEAKSLLRAIGREVERLSALSQQYLAVARQKPGLFELEDVAELVRDASDFVRRELEQSGVELVLELASEGTTVRADEAQLRQAVLNLLRNAKEAMPSGGRVWVRVAPNGEGGVAVEVEDEGKGIDARVRERLFEPFFTTKGHGTGLGLAITRQIALAHGGNIQALPRAGGAGTRFVLSLPNAGASPAAGEGGAPEPVSPSAGDGPGAV